MVSLTSKKHITDWWFETWISFHGDLGDGLLFLYPHYIYIHTYIHNYPCIYLSIYLSIYLCMHRKWSWVEYMNMYGIVRKSLCLDYQSGEWRDIKGPVGYLSIPYIICILPMKMRSGSELPRVSCCQSWAATNGTCCKFRFKMTLVGKLEKKKLSLYLMWV